MGMDYVGVGQLKSPLVFYVAGLATLTTFFAAFGGLTISEDGGLELLEEFFCNRATVSCSASS